VKKEFKIGEYLVKLQARAWLSHALCTPWPARCYKTKKVHETITFLLVTLPNIYRFKKSTDRLGNKLFQIWLLTTPPNLQHVASLPCKLSLMACFADIKISQGSVATCARCSGIFNIHLTTNLPRNISVNILKPVKI